MSHKIEVVSDRRSLIGEGPFWDNANQKLLYVDIIGGDVCRLNPELKKTEIRHFEDFTSSVFPIVNDEKLLISIGCKLSQLNFETGEHSTLAGIEDENNSVRFNDGKCDSAGRLWIGTMGIEKEPGVFEKQRGALYKVTDDYNIIKQVDKVSISNGITWSSDNRTMYFIDSLLKRIDSFDYKFDESAISNRQTVVKFAEDDGFPDGMTIDQQGHLWVAFYDGWKIVELDPETGKALRTITFPVSQITSCCFGGPTYDDLYVTSGSLYLTDEQIKMQPEAGSVFKVTGLNSKGNPGDKFAA